MIALFTGAYLLFWCQPLTAKKLLPTFGGSPTVWTSCMLFFQLMLLLGYGYVYLINKLAIKKQVMTHLCLIAISLSHLYFHNFLNFKLDSINNSILWIVLNLTLSFGLILFVISSTAPLLQNWFGKLNYNSSKNPYYLYIASNIGSLLALIAFPVVLEPRLDVNSQYKIWLGLYAFLAILCGVIGGMCITNATHTKTSITKNATVAKPSLRNYAAWIILSFAPSIYLISITSFITNELCSHPLLWVLPLGLYLLSFIIAFAEPKNNLFNKLLTLQLFVAVIFFSPATISEFSAVLLLVFHISLFFISSLLIHGKLVQLKPPASHLPSFYLTIAFGGLLGSVGAIIASSIFNFNFEYPIAIGLAFILRGFYFKNTSIKISYLFLAMLILFGFSFIKYLDLNLNLETKILIILYGVCFFLVLHNKNNSFLVATIVFCVLLANFNFLPSNDKNLLYASRGFYGSYKVVHNPKANKNTLYSGTTIHGEQYFSGINNSTNAVYYSTVNDLIINKHKAKERLDIAAIGLGAGIISCMATEDNLKFFEIDPMVVKIANNPNYFTYLQNCAPKLGIEIGDARINLVKEQNAAYDILIIDAFNSDSIPTHLLTIEAMQLYLQKINPTGTIAIHISNRYFDFRKILQPFIPHLNINIEYIRDNTSHWALVTPGDKSKTFAQKDASLPLWTDSYSNILSIIKS